MLFCFILHRAYFLSGYFRGISIDPSTGPDTMSCTQVKSDFQSSSSAVQAWARGTEHGSAWIKYIYDRIKASCVWYKCVNMHLVCILPVTWSKEGSGGGEYKPVNLKAFFSLICNGVFFTLSTFFEFSWVKAVNKQFIIFWQEYDDPQQ